MGCPQPTLSHTVTFLPLRAENGALEEIEASNGFDEAYSSYNDKR